MKTLSKLLCLLIFTCILSEQTLATTQATRAQLQILELSNLDAQIDQAVNTTQAKPTKFDKILSRLSSRAPKLEKKLYAKMNQLSDAELEQQNLNRDDLENSIHERVQKTLPILAKRISDAGGVVPFLIHAKSELREMKKQAQQANRASDHLNRSPANDMSLQLWAGIAFLSLLIIFVLALCTPISFPIYVWAPVLMSSLILATAAGYDN